MQLLCYACGFVTCSPARPDSRERDRVMVLANQRQGLIDKYLGVAAKSRPAGNAIKEIFYCDPCGAITRRGLDECLYRHRADKPPLLKCINECRANRLPLRTGFGERKV